VTATVVADGVSVLGLDPVFPRFRNLTDRSVSLYLQEDQSLDNETAHLSEVVSVLIAE